MKNEEYSFTFLLSKFLTTYCQEQRNFSKNTIHSYATTFKLFIKYCIEIKNIDIREISFKNIDDTLINDFLKKIENERSISTRNQRLAAIKSFYQFAITENPSEISSGVKILKIKSKKYNYPTIDFISQDGISLLFQQPNIKTLKGRNDLVILTTLYDTACRIDEFLNIKIADLHLECITPYIDICGKGRKNRIVTIRNEIKDNLKNYIIENNLQNNSQFLFSHNGKKYTRQGITYIIFKYVSIAKKIKDIFPKKITPHIFRHSKAMHLIQNGAHLEEIQDYLGHESINTTRIYAKYNLEQQSKALEKNSKLPKNAKLPKWQNDENIIKFLENL